MARPRVPRPALTGDVRQTWPGKRWYEPPGPVVKVRHSLRVALDRQPLEFSLSLALALFGVRALFDPAASPNSIGTLPDGLTVIYCLVSVVAGVTTIIGLTAGAYETEDEPDMVPPVLHGRRWARGVEQAGLWLSAAAWASYLVGLLASAQTSTSATLVGLALLSLCFGNFWRAHVLKKRQEQRLASLRLARSIIESPPGSREACDE